MTANLGTRISTAADFPRLAVYAREDPEGPVYTVSFTNNEFGSNGRRAVGIALSFLVLLIPIALGNLGFRNELLIIVTLVYLAVLVVLHFSGWHRVFPPYPYPVTVELDVGRDRIVVRRNGRRVVERAYSALHNLTVEDHPDAEHSRRNRELRGEKRLSNNEKQHCLFGWFGGGGAEQVPLVTRMEWPNRNSLFEVRQAILWTNEKARSQAAQEFETEGRGIKPPLD
jgi:hypothetical protein